MSSTELELKSTEYFATLNPLARKIHQDVEETKDSYDEMWKKLSAEQQIEIINEALIKPEITLWYYDLQHNSSSKEETELSSEKSSLLTPLDSVTSPDTKVTPSNTLYNFDGKHLSTFASMHSDINGQRDEHAPPFSYKTKSQMNLNMFADPGRPVSSPKILLSPERINKANMLNANGITTPVNKASASSGKCSNSVVPTEKSDVKFERFFNDKNTEKNGKAGFFTKFLSSVTGNNGNGSVDLVDRTEYATLVPAKNMLYSNSDEIDLLTTSEDSHKLLLHQSGESDEPVTDDCDFDLRKNFDFLNNW